jgi:CO dehydrogenase nickel-insertion accessory protein CooC1
VWKLTVWITGTGGPAATTIAATNINHSASHTAKAVYFIQHANDSSVVSFD